ncbi:TetR/AcrR family transcriptional regulator [Pseudomonas sp. LP_7_YM]|uniref:TetR/AcrR family transcriptional regulator n=1 Tax=Pseudomonas sp. LP_7_YM TaxID=2485137 RepID=UPI00105BA92A|nr:TetR/AcrR family transcriptional regulator [Pseudomonas sp. LP_7_YM]TDV67912.1 TetR family transcriptional regulator [Pseudomonas sp. LP_7_YM]
MLTTRDFAANHQRLIDAASALFFRDGINATGIAAVAEFAGVSKMTLYAHFTSKDELIVAFLDKRNERWEAAVQQTLGSGGTPATQLLDLFDLHRQWLREGGWRGCPYVNSAAEFPDRSHPVRLAVDRHKRGMKQHLLDLAEAAGLANPRTLVRRLFMLLEGAFLTGALEHDDSVFLIAKDLAAELIDAARSA